MAEDTFDLSVAPAAPSVRAPRRAILPPLRDLPVVLALFWLGLVVLLAAFAPLLPIPDPGAQDLISMLAPPGAQWPAVILLHGSFVIGYLIANPPNLPAARGRDS